MTADRAGSVQSAPADTAAMVGRATLIILAGSALSRLLGLVREQVLAARYGTGDGIAAFTVADNVQSLIFELTTNGMLQTALIPALAGLTIVAGSAAAVRRATGALLTLTLLISGSLAALGMIFAPLVVAGMTSILGDTDSRDAETTRLTIELLRWLLPAVPLLGAGAVMMAALHASGRPTAPSVAPAVRNAIFVACAIALTGPLGPRALAIGTVLGALAIIAVQLPAMAHAQVLAWPNRAIRQPAVRTVLRLSGPVLMALLVTTAITIIDRNLAWRAGNDTIGAMRYATTLVQTILGLIAAAVSLAALPTLARHHEAHDEAAFGATLRQALTLVTVLIFPVVLGMAVLAGPIVGLLFGHGATTAAGERAITIALWGYLPGALAAAYAQVLIFAFYARRDTRTPLLLTGTGAIAYLLIALPFADRFGLPALALANSALWIATLVGTGIQGRRHLSLMVTVPWSTIGICALAATLASATVGVGTVFTGNRLGGLGERSLAADALVVSIGGLTFAAIYGLLVRKHVASTGYSHAEALRKMLVRFSRHRRA